MFFIKKIWQEKADDAVHAQFVRFGRGQFENRAVINASRNGNAKLEGSFELANDFVLFVSDLAEQLTVSGIIFSKSNLGSEIGQRGKQKEKLFVYEINKELSSKELREIAAKSYAALLDCSAPGIRLKIKKRLPRPSTKGAEKVDEKFCIMQLESKFWPSIREEFFFELPEFKKGKISHTYIIKEIIRPQGEKDFEKIRVLAKRKGKLIRKAILDGKEIVQEKEFIV